MNANAPTPAADPDSPEFPTRRSIVAGPVVAAVTLFAALLATHDVGVPFRDPDHVVGKRLALVACGVALLVVLDIVVRAGWRSRKLVPSLGAIRASSASAGHGVEALPWRSLWSAST